MGLKFVNKRFMKYKSTEKPQKEKIEPKIEKVEEKPIKKNKQKENNKEINDTTMFDKDKISNIEAITNQMKPEVKYLKKEKGLIERTESSKIILTEDNRQVLTD